jgi:hypothetical protein
MAAIITEKFRQHNAEQFQESFSEAAATTYYLFIGKSSPFTGTTSGGDDNAPPTPSDDVTSEFYKWDSMLAAKLISSSDVSFVIPRRNWANSTTYDMYEHDISASNTTTSSAINLYDSTFYFMTSAFRVYKVLDNNGGVAYSGAEPTTVNANPFELGGYTLQYMYTLSQSQISKFLTSDFIPVTTDVNVSGAATNGSIDALRVTAGSGYTNGTYYAAIDGDGTNAGGANGAIALIKVVGGAISAFKSTGSNLFAPGAGYTFGTVDLTTVFSNTALTTAANIGSGSGGSVQPIISPKGGHGFNAVRELGGHYVMMNTKLEQTEGDDFTVANDFREVGIVRNPFNFGTTTVATASQVRQTYAIVMAASPSSPYEIDEKITQSTTGAVGKVVEWDATRKILYYQQEQYANYGIASSGNHVAFSGANAVTGASSNAAATPSATASQAVTLAGGTVVTFGSGYLNPELAADSGDIIYVENRRPISRASDQTEDIKIVVEF